MKPPSLILCVAIASSCCFASSATAREARSEQVPNGQKLDCGLCHVASSGEGPRNVFGTQIEEMGLDGEGAIATQLVVWAQIYMLDADGDGFTNGYELGDPEGTWRPTDNDPSVFPSLPGDPDSVPCPNGSVHPGEECDGADLAGQTCLSLGFTGGSLACSPQCTFDTSSCLVAEFPDLGGGGGGPDLGPIDMRDDVGVPPQPGADVASARPVNEPTPTEDGGGCGGGLEVRQPDAGLDASWLALVVLGWRRRRD